MPMFRLQSRFKLFGLRDRLIYLKISGQLKDDKIFDLVNSSINSSIKILPYISLYVIFRSSDKLAHNEPLVEEIEKKINTINTSHKEVIEIYNQGIYYLVRALVFNTGAWIIYLLPIFIIAYILQKIQIVAFNITKRVKQMILLTEQPSFYSCDTEFA
jgi:hypothetical protein